MKNKLTKDQQVSVAEVINGESVSFEAINICPNAIDIYMQSLGYETGEFETNGWQYDWWLNFTKGEENWTAFGSGYYGTFEFRKTED